MEIKWGQIERMKEVAHSIRQSLWGSGPAVSNRKANRDDRGLSGKVEGIKLHEILICHQLDVTFRKSI